MNWHGIFLFIHLSDGAARSSLRRLTGTSLSTGDLSRNALPDLRNGSGGGGGVLPELKRKSDLFLSAE